MSTNGTRPASRQEAGRNPEEGSAKAKPKTAWRVIHACEYARDVLPVVEGQLACGMRPYIVTPQGAGSGELFLARPHQEQVHTFSLLRSWQDVRNWRKSILESDPENSADVVHAHAFAAGMAGVRSCGCVVYDMTGCIEELAVAAHLCEPGSWMGRSFRVAEQFILSRSSAVVVHSNGMKTAVMERGAPANSIFVIPEPLPVNEDDHVTRYFEARTPITNAAKPAGGRTSIFVPEFAAANAEKLPSAAETMLEAFALAVQETPTLCMVLEAPKRLHASLRELGARLAIAENLQPLDPIDANEINAAWKDCDVVIAGAEIPHDVVLARQANTVCLKAMVAGKALLAADTPRHRDVSPDGRGCLWFDATDPRDLGHRVSFLAHNPEFRAALASAGKAFVTESRSMASIGAKYDAVYRHAINRKKTMSPGPGLAPFQMAPNFT